MNNHQPLHANMTQLRNHLAEAFELIGIPSKDLPVPETTFFRSLLDLLAHDHALHHYLDMLDSHAVQATARIKEINFELWNSRENEKQLDEAEKNVSSLENKLQAATAANTHLAAENNMLMKKLHTSEEEIGQLSQSIQQLLNEQEKMYLQMISLRDSLQMRLEWMRSNAPEEINAARLTESLLDETARLMENMGVHILTMDGPFDSATQTIVATAETNDPLLVNHVAETVRPGYATCTGRLRSQEVKVYIASKERSVCP